MCIVMKTKQFVLSGIPNYILFIHSCTHTQIDAHKRIFFFLLLSMCLYLVCSLFGPPVAYLHIEYNVYLSIQCWWVHQTTMPHIQTHACECTLYSDREASRKGKRKIERDFRPYGLFICWQAHLFAHRICN